jgi:hypothetical protein
MRQNIISFAFTVLLYATTLYQMHRLYGFECEMKNRYEWTVEKQVVKVVTNLKVLHPYFTQGMG